MRTPPVDTSAPTPLVWKLTSGVRRVAEVALHLTVVHQAVEHHAVDLDGRVGLARAVAGHVDLFHLLVAADVGRALADARHQRRQARVVAGARHRVEQLAVEHLRPLRALHVDHRRGAGDGDRLLERADLQVGVDRGREVGRQLETPRLWTC